MYTTTHGIYTSHQQQQQPQAHQRRHHPSSAGKTKHQNSTRFNCVLFFSTHTVSTHSSCTRVHIHHHLLLACHTFQRDSQHRTASKHQRQNTHTHTKSQSASLQRKSVHGTATRATPDHNWPHQYTLTNTMCMPLSSCSCLSFPCTQMCSNLPHHMHHTPAVVYASSGVR